jgi:hypothetical protein
MLSEEKNWNYFPKFRHNLLTNYDNEPEVTYLTVSHGKFEIPRHEAEEFLKIRGFCTGHAGVEEIARKSGLPIERTRQIIDSLIQGDMLRRTWKPFEAITQAEIQGTLLAATRIWSEQLRETHIAVEVFNGDVSREVALGWLLETYHYIRCFPGALEIAAAGASGELHDVLKTYAQQEQGHELFVEQSLCRLGLRPEEVRHSAPLVTTRLIDLLMRELFKQTPCAALLVAAIVEADDFRPEELPAMHEAFARHYDAPEDGLVPFFRHSQIDADLGHGTLAMRYAHLLTFRSETELAHTVNCLHDLKHAFDAQKLEIKDYYSRGGNYFPRQRVDFFSI